jgi:hypothetical protein
MPGAAAVASGGMRRGCGGELKWRHPAFLFPFLVLVLILPAGGLA